MISNIRAEIRDFLTNRRIAGMVIYAVIMFTTSLLFGLPVAVSLLILAIWAGLIIATALVIWP